MTPFPTTTDGVSLADIQHTWAGAPSGPFAGRPLWMDGATLAAFSALWGGPVAGAVHVARADQLVDSAWAERPAWAIVPFEALEPRWKVLSVDGQSPVHNDFDPAGLSTQNRFFAPAAAFNLPPTNRDPNKLTVLAMTGTTALVRARLTGWRKKACSIRVNMIDSVLRSADITHISNEVSFDAKCPTPDPWTLSLFFAAIRAILPCWRMPARMWSN